MRVVLKGERICRHEQTQEPGPGIMPAFFLFYASHLSKTAAGQPMLSESDLKRIYWASRRGMLELDLILVPFVEQCLPSASADVQQAYVRLLESEDTELFAWFLQRERPGDEELAGIVEQILEFARTVKR